ncbi:UPF0187-domain-containing protein [Exidia glandulosa HHB12029]|uniref:UPF0187-domain-containing protein n=1 Tax=Exidia glandulosa HHB12029 TaxID=1314781 RepID=A0A166AVQ9_EXIGL|nr:UPF0187-domain-containing protein [Exidia glandulosa HHB12029]
MVKHEHHVPLGRSASAPVPDADPVFTGIPRVKTDIVMGTQHVQEVSKLDWLEHPHSFIRGMWQAFLATALFRCWHMIVFFAAEAAVITWAREKNGADITVNSNLVTVLGTFIGFIISLRTSASFDRYHEGRRYWSQLAHNAGMLGRIIWFHVPENKPAEGQSEDQARAYTLVEKRTAINLVEAFAVAIKHHLRGEDGIYYEDLYHLVKCLPAYAMATNVLSPMYARGPSEKQQFQPFPHPSDHDMTRVGTAATFKGNELPLPATASVSNTDLRQRRTFVRPAAASATSVGRTADGEPILMPARMPPSTTIFDVWPLSMFVRVIQARGKRLQGKKAARDRARHIDKYGNKSGNVPIEISLYLNAYFRAQQSRGVDGLIIANLFEHLKQLLDANVGLERIQTTPIPFSYSVHLWTITLLYLALLPFQLVDSLGWLNIAASALAAFAYCGLLKAGDEIEQPFGYDYNDLNLDHFTKHIIRRELRALTAMPIQDPVEWMFSNENDTVFDDPVNSRLHPSQKTKTKHPGVVDHTHELRKTPEEWVRLGETRIMSALAMSGGVDADAGMFVSDAPAMGVPHIPTSMTLKPVPRTSTDAGAIMQTTSQVPEDQQRNGNSLAAALT